MRAGSGGDTVDLGSGDDRLGGQGNDAAEKAFGDPGHEAIFWAPGGGKDGFNGGDGTDPLHLPTMNPDR